MTFKNEIWKSLVTEEVTSAYCSFGYFFGYGFQERFSILSDVKPKPNQLRTH